jgi:anti-anti-sigma regulatory factor
VDVSGVDSIDTSGVQLLLAAAMEWRRREQSLTLTGYEHLIFGAAEQLGLQTLLPVAGGVEP